MRLSPILFVPRAPGQATSPVFRCIYSQTYRPTPTYFQLQTGPNSVKVEAELRRRPRTGLWLHIFRRTSDFRAKIVESKTRKRIRHAFHDALHAEGFDEHGVVKEDRKGIVAALQNRNKLRGTLWITPNGPAALKVEYADVVQQARNLLQQLQQV